MPARPDLTLPSTAPSVRQYQNRPQEFYPIALYTLISLSDTDLSSLQAYCESHCRSTQPGQNVRLAPRCKFIGKRLRKVFDYHLELGRGNEYHPTMFLVIVDYEWEDRGVLLVTLDDDSMECKVDSFRIAVREAGLAYVNLNAQNLGWSEAKETYGIRRNRGVAYEGDEGYKEEELG